MCIDFQTEILTSGGEGKELYVPGVLSHTLVGNGGKTCLKQLLGRCEMNNGSRSRNYVGICTILV